MRSVRGPAMPRLEGELRAIFLEFHWRFEPESAGCVHGKLQSRWFKALWLRDQGASTTGKVRMS